MAFVATSPRGSLLRSLSAMQHNTWFKNICEWIDNALDAGASRIEIEWGRGNAKGAEHVSISDDGRGVHALGAFFRLGEHVEHPKSEVGMFGVGGTMAQAWACDNDGVSSVRTVHEGVLREGRCDWSAILHHDLWGFDAIVERPSVDGDPVGTKILVRPCARRIPERGERFDSLLTELGFTYARALDEGKQIRLRRSPGEPWRALRPWHLPELEPGAIRREISVGHRKALVHAGIVPDGTPNPNPGLTYYYGFRAVTTTGRGCGDYDTTHIRGRVELLGRDWPVTTNKNDFQDTAVAEHLFTAVFDAIHPVLLAAQQRADRLDLASLTDDVSNLLNGLACNAKAKRAPKKGSGSHASTGAGGKHRRAKTTQPGDRIRGGGTRYMVQWLDAAAWTYGDDKLAHFDRPRIYFNACHPWMGAMRERREVEALLAIAAVAVGVSDKSALSGQTSMTFVAGDVLAYAGRLLRRRSEITAVETERGTG